MRLVFFQGDPSKKGCVYIPSFTSQYTNTPQVSDLQYASPATVSRCGMVYVDPKNLGYMPFWQRWINSRESKVEQDYLNQLFNKYVPSCIDMILEGVVDGKQGERLKNIVPVTNLNMVGGAFYL